MFAELDGISGSLTGVLGAFVGIFALVTAIVGYLVARVNNATQLTARIDVLTNQVFDLEGQARNCERREGDLKAELTRALMRIAHLEREHGMEPGESSVGVVVADLRGIIRVFSPSLTPLFRWLPQELIGKPITILMPPDERQHHSKKFAMFVSDTTRTTLDSSFIILTYAINKHGDCFPVAITLSGWQVGTEGLITATIRERAIGSNPTERAKDVLAVATKEAKGVIAQAVEQAKKEVESVH